MRPIDEVQSYVNNLKSNLIYLSDKKGIETIKREIQIIDRYLEDPHNMNLDNKIKTIKNEGDRMVYKWLAGKAS